MIRSRIAWAVATNQSRSVAELASLPTTSASLARTALLNSARSSSSCELVGNGVAFERLRPGSAMASAVVLAFSSQRRLVRDDRHLLGYQALLQDICRTAQRRAQPRGARRYLFFLEEFTREYWRWNSFATLMFWVRGVW